MPIDPCTHMSVSIVRRGVELVVWCIHSGWMPCLSDLDTGGRSVHRAFLLSYTVEWPKLTTYTEYIFHRREPALALAILIVHINKSVCSNCAFRGIPQFASGYPKRHLRRVVLKSYWNISPWINCLSNLWKSYIAKYRGHVDCWRFSST